jgi:hypothetical protein
MRGNSRRGIGYLHTISHLHKYSIDPTSNICSSYLLRNFAMTTFTKLAPHDEPVISVHPAFPLAEVDRNVFGGFVEYVTHFPPHTFSL